MEYFSSDLQVESSNCNRSDKALHRGLQVIRQVLVPNKGFEALCSQKRRLTLARSQPSEDKHSGEQNQKACKQKCQRIAERQEKIDAHAC